MARYAKTGERLYCFLFRLPVCKSAPNAKVGFHSADVCSAPLERIYIGFFLPITCTKRGNVGLVAVIDGFSKYVSLHPDRAFTSQQIINFFVTEYVPNFGVPRSIFSDNARAFKCNLFKSLNFN